MAKLNMVQALNLALRQEMERDERVVVLGEDVGVNGGVFRVTEGLLERFGPDRVIDTPLSELGIVGVSVGLAIYGFRPVAEIQFEGFLPPTLDQIICHVSRFRTRSRGRFTIPLVIRSPYGGGVHAPELHSDAPEAYFTHTPGIKVVIPSTPYDAKGLLASAIRDPDPIIFFEPKKIYRAIREEVPEDGYTVPIGVARAAREGEDVSILSWGALVHTCLEAAERLKDEGISAEVIDLRTLSPLDIDAVVKSVKKTGRAVIVHEAPRTCGLGAEISALINERALLHLEAPVKRVTGYDTVIPLPRLEKYYFPDVDKIIRAVREVMAF